MNRTEDEKIAKYSIMYSKHSRYTVNQNVCNVLILFLKRFMSYI